MSADGNASAREFRFRKGERLRLRSLVNYAYDDGRSIFEWPLRAVVRPVAPEELQRLFPHGIPDGIGRLQVMITVPKKRRRHAVDRVLMRRRIREAWRLGRAPLRLAVDGAPAGSLRTLSVALNYVADRNLDYVVVEKAMNSLICKILRKTLA